MNKINDRLMEINVQKPREARKISLKLTISSLTTIRVPHETTLSVITRFYSHRFLSEERAHLSHRHFAMQPRSLAPTDEQRDETRSHVL